MIRPGDSDGRDNIFLEIKQEIERRGKFDLKIVQNVDDACVELIMNVRVRAIVYDWDTGTTKIPRLISKINDDLPVFAFSLSHTAKDLDINDLILNLNFLDYVAYSASDSADRIEKAILSYEEKIIPAFTKSLMNFTKENKYPYCTPGHLGGAAYLKSPAGSIFYDFFGPNIFKADLSVSMFDLGSLLDHSGPHKLAEDFIAKTFNTDRSLIVINGSSTANKIVGMSVLHQKETVIIDRNAHKSIAHLLMMTDVLPIYFKTCRNAYGIIGGIQKKEFTTEAIQQKIKDANESAKKNNIKAEFKWPIYALITNSTYDGILYNTDYIKKTLDVKNIHFDGAWIPYAHFSPIYKGLYGISSEAIDGKTIFETSSTHKLLAAFSQTSMIHIKGKFDETVVNEAYMMHTSTSPFYPIVASAEMAVAMMTGTSGTLLMKSSQDIAMDFRYEIKKLHKQNSQGWFFDVWQPDDVGSTIKCWPIEGSEKWHGFKKIDSDHMYLDPIKITILTPGLENGHLTDFGIPAAILAKYLDDHGIVVEKSGPYSILFLYTIGIDNAKSLKLLSELIEFKREFDADLPISKILPGLYKQDPVLYSKMTIQQLAKGIHEVHKKYHLPEVIDKAYDVLPKQLMTPYQAYQELVKTNIEVCNIKNLSGKICAEMILPYPPGIPVIFPGECIDSESKPILDCLLTLCEIGKNFTGFSTEIHGTWKEDDGEYYVKVIKQNTH